MQRTLFRTMAALALLFCFTSVRAADEDMKADKAAKKTKDAKDTKEPETAVADDKDYKVFTSKTGDKYHCKDCSALGKNPSSIMFSEVAKNKLEPCAICKPDVVVYTTAKGNKFHMQECHYAAKSPISMAMAAAIDKKMSPCKSCNPPDGKK